MAAQDWPDMKPGCLPWAVWNCAKYLRDSPQLKPEQQSALLRLVESAELCRTWERLERKQVSERGYWMLMSVLVHSVPGAGLELDRCTRPDTLRDKLDKIASQASALAALIDDAAAFAEQHRLRFPDELRDTNELLKLTSEPAYNLLLPRHHPQPKPGPEAVELWEILKATPPSRVLLAMADICAATPARLRYAADSYASHNPKKTGIAVNWVRFFHHNLPFAFRGLFKTRVDYSRFGTAVLDDVVVTESNVTYALNTSPKESGEVDQLLVAFQPCQAAED